jgi:hypothetical protein
VPADSSPLAATLTRIAAADDWGRYVAGEPSGDGWFGLDDLHSRPALLHGWLDELVAGEAQGHREVAGSYLSSWLGSIVAGPVALAVLGERRAWCMEPAGLAVHRAPGGWFDGLAVRRPVLWVLAGDPAALDLDSKVVPDVAALRSQVARGLVGVLGPLFDTLRARAPVGLPAMWGAVADAIASGALADARWHGTDGNTAWREASRLIDVLERAAPALRARPALERVDWSGGCAHFAVRGVCCLYFRVSRCPRDPRGDVYCTSCPFRDDADRRRRWAAWLEQQALAGGAASA